MTWKQYCKLCNKMTFHKESKHDSDIEICTVCGKASSLYG